MDRGYIKLFRRLLDSPIWKERRRFSKAEVWIDILLSVRYSEEAEEVFIGSQKFVCNQGESLFSLDTWSNRWGMTKSSARRVLALFEKEGMIKLNDERKTTRLKVLKYCEFNERRNTEETQMNHKRNADDTQVNRKRNTDETSMKRGRNGIETEMTPNKKDKKEKKEKKKREGKKSEDFSSLIEKILCAWEKICPNLPQVQKWTPARNRKLLARISEDKDRQKIEFWEELFGMVAQSPFLCGANDRAWMADLPWILERQDKIFQICEGKYAPRSQKPASDEDFRQQFYRQLEAGV